MTITGPAEPDAAVVELGTEHLKQAGWFDDLSASVDKHWKAQTPDVQDALRGAGIGAGAGAGLGFLTGRKRPFADALTGAALGAAAGGAVGHLPLPLARHGREEYEIADRRQLRRQVLIQRPDEDVARVHVIQGRTNSYGLEVFLRQVVPDSDFRFRGPVQGRFSAGFGPRLKPNAI
ncbi:hypothetical protein PX52LOC_04389 [Limnoglobus roseus]|uniref:Glycine zipper 2TM domain-containing protein n=2 Tax=Limnoglobus roseus TaxID=2598579 RepID=A0A5C1ADU0_9BACT|nr:hypothetical protein PX52LOC_04389 [Limnoglobus roseus]